MTGGDQRVERGGGLGDHRRLLPDVRAPAGADDVDVVQQQPVHAHLGDRAAGEADDDRAPVAAQRAQAVREAVAADGIEHDVDTAARELLRRVLPVAVGAQDLVGARLARDLLLLVGRDDRERARPEPLRHLQRRRPDAAGRAVHEHRLALGQAPAQLQREVRRVVVEDQPGALRVVELVRERERELRLRQRDLGEPAEHAERGHAVALAHRRALRRAPHDARDLAARHERQVRLDLVLAARLQHLGERDAGGVDVDHDALAVRLRHFCELQRLRAAELDDLDRPHGATPYGPASASWQEAPPLHARIARELRGQRGLALRRQRRVDVAPLERVAREVVVLGRVGRVVVLHVQRVGEPQRGVGRRVAGRPCASGSPAPVFGPRCSISVASRQLAGG